MGFSSGFSGGLTLTLGLAYLAVYTHQRNRERQAAVLRQQTQVLHSFTDPVPAPLPPTRAEVEAARRADFVETAKERWNTEIGNAVRWAQSKDWEEVREDVETAAGKLWDRAFGDAVKGTEAAEKKGAELAAEAKAEGAKSVQKGKSALADAKAKTSEVAAKAEEKAGEAKTSLLGAIGKSLQKGREMVGQATSAIGIAEQKAEEKVKETISETLSPVDRALQQRYEKHDQVKGTPEQVLAERYLPMDKRDNSVLRGV